MKAFISVYFTNRDWGMLNLICRCIVVVLYLCSILCYVWRHVDVDTNQHVPKAEETAAGRGAWVKEGAGLLSLLMHLLWANTLATLWARWLSSFNNCINSYTTAHELSTSALIYNVCKSENSHPNTHQPGNCTPLSHLVIIGCHSVTALKKQSPSFITILNAHTKTHVVR